MNRQALLANGGTIAAFVVFGGATAATRAAGREIPPFSLAVLRFGLAGGLILAVLALTARHQLRVARRDWPRFLALGLTFGGFALCFNWGLRLTEASRGGLMLSTAPLWTALLARLLGWERLTRRQLVGLLLTSGGILLVLAERGVRWEGGGRGLLGDAILLCGVLVATGNFLLAKAAYRRYAALPVTAYSMLLGAALLLLAALTEGLPGVIAGLGGTQLALVLYLALPGGALAYGVVYVALRYLTPTQSAVYIHINPLTATILGVALLGERLTPLFLIGFAVVLAGVLLVNLPKTLGLRRRVSASEVPV